MGQEEDVLDGKEVTDFGPLSFPATASEQTFEFEGRRFQFFKGEDSHIRDYVKGKTTFIVPAGYQVEVHGGQPSYIKRL